MLLLICALLIGSAAAVLARRGVLRWAGAAALTTVALLTAGIVELTDAVVEHDGATRIDQPAVDWVLPHRTGWLTRLAVAISDLGDTTTMGAVALVACAWFAYRRRWPQFAVTAAAAAGAGLVVGILKIAVGRARPPVVDHLVTETNQSFPSGHTMGSTAVVGVLTALTVFALRRRAARVAVIAAAAVFVVAVGLSRLYLGVHWPTDIIAGWALGTVDLILCLTLYLRFVRHTEPRMVAQPA
ncbi:phosphatase PAP2 family protein [Nocardia stercoris]|uniref:phosphatase PAP2 family protein n=1 Tax=Nocardia stercoris TaxID=2483361 RepID=UPI001319FB5E|nr:phosphatase PAP2 family protein [Nocardia stercoris]